MDKKQCIDYWLDSAAHDMEAADMLFHNGQYNWCLFIGHLVIEKILKAFFVRDNDDFPPRTHNLARLSENVNLIFSEEQKQFLLEINRFNIEARYPDYKNIFYKLCNKEFTEDYFERIKELYQWLLTRM